MAKKKQARLRRATPKAARKNPRARRRAADSSGNGDLTGRTFPIVGIGMSAGGLEACRQLIESLRSDIGIAIVLVPHLDPTHESMLPTLLGESSKIPVV